MALNVSRVTISPSEWKASRPLREKREFDSEVLRRKLKASVLCYVDNRAFVSIFLLHPGFFVSIVARIKGREKQLDTDPVFLETISRVNGGAGVPVKVKIDTCKLSRQTLFFRLKDQSAYASCMCNICVSNDRRRSRIGLATFQECGFARSFVTHIPRDDVRTRLQRRGNFAKTRMSCRVTLCDPLFVLLFFLFLISGWFAWRRELLREFIRRD